MKNIIRKIRYGRKARRLKKTVRQGDVFVNGYGYRYIVTRTGKSGVCLESAPEAKPKSGLVLFYGGDDSVPWLILAARYYPQSASDSVELALRA